MVDQKVSIIKREYFTRAVAQYAAMLSTVDIVVLVFAVVASLGLGLFLAYRSKQHSTVLEYFLGGRGLHYLPVAVSLTVTFESSVLVLGYPAEVYIHGISHLLVVLGLIPAVLIASCLFTPTFHTLKITSVYDYITKRFQNNVEVLRMYFVFLGGLYTVIYMAIVLLGPGFVFEALLGLPLWASVIGSAVVATLYTSLGGMRAVVWTDTFQFFVMVTGLLAILIKVTVFVGGVGNLIDINSRFDRMQLFNIDPDPRIRHTFWTLVIGSFFRVWSMIFSQQTIQRCNSTSNVASARKVLLIFITLHSLVHCLGDFCGLAAFGYYAFKGCDPIKSGRIKNPNQIVIAIVSDLFVKTPGAAGLIIAALISASLSTLSSGYNSLSAITTTEIFRRYLKSWDDRRKTKVAKIFVAVYGLISTLLALALMFVKGSFNQIFVSILGSLGAPSAGMFLVCLLNKRATSTSVLLGGISGLLVSMWFTVGFNFSKTLPRTPWLQPGPTVHCNTNNTIVVNRQFLTNLTVTESYDLYTTYTTNDSTTLIHTSTLMENNQDMFEVRITPKGIDNMYSISYQYFSVVAVLVTILTSLLSNVFISRCRYTDGDGIHAKRNEHSNNGVHADTDVSESLI